jgi:hypothetical protein
LTLELLPPPGVEYGEGLMADTLEPPINSATMDDQKRFEVELEFVQCLANPNYLNCTWVFFLPCGMYSQQHGTVQFWPTTGILRRSHFSTTSSI